jgi:hypothetical protein
MKPSNNYVSNYTRSKKRERLPGFDPAIMEHPFIMQNTNINPMRMMSVCMPEFGVVGMRERPSHIMISQPLDEFMEYNWLPFVLKTDVKDILNNPGTYTWLLFSDGMLAAAKTLTNDELHSKHIDIYSAFQKPVVAAGELSVSEEKDVEFNFDSGTFMYEIIKKHGHSGVDMEKLKTQLEAVFKAAGARNVHNTDRSLTRWYVSTKEDLKLFQDNGFTVWKFNDHDECDNFRYWLKKFQAHCKIDYMNINRTKKSPFTYSMHEKTCMDGPVKQVLTKSQGKKYLVGGRVHKTRRAYRK